ncbi:cytochrome P450 [Aspergillus pseudodeflectus]|uniref:Cytochrome P450 n=1 Tax=Aspergillus pseudodeflectus TaxID=176178 RepID=A0ABR4K1V8_9EURO
MTSAATGFYAPARDKLHRRLGRHDSGQLEDIVTTFRQLMLAASETTSAAMGAIVNALARHPRIMERIKAEVRSVSSSTDGLSLAALGQLPYLNAVIKERLRLYHPTPPAVTRVTPPEGKTIAGVFVPENTHVGICHYAAYTTEANFPSATSFLPERWLVKAEEKSPSLHENDSNIKTTSISVFEPFAVGGHSCIGQNLTWVEMRLVLAHLVHGFDIEAVDPFRWDEQESYFFWKRRAFMVRLTPVGG